MPRQLVQNFVSSLQFDGVATKIVPTTNLASVPYTGSISGACWIKIPSNSTQRVLFGSQQVGSPFQGYGFSLTTAGRLQIEYYVSSGNTFKATTVNVVAFPNAFVHLAFNYSNKSFSVWVNGVSQAVTVNANTSTSSYSNAVPFAIGIRDSSGDKFSGIMTTLSIFNGYAITQSDVFNLINGLPIGQAPTVQYLLKENAGTVANDSSPNANNGTITSPTWVTDVPSPPRTVATNRQAVQDFKCSLSLLGASQYALIPHTAAYNLSTFSISFWYRRLAPTPISFGRLLDKRQASTTTGWAFLQNTNTTPGGATPYFELRNSAGAAFGAVGSLLQQGIQRHYIATFDGTNVILRENGVVVATTPFTGTYSNSTNPLVVNSNTTVGGTNYGNMGIAGLKYHNHPLSDAEALAVYSGADISGDVGKFMAGEGMGTVLYDTSLGTSNNGTITNGTYTLDVPSKKRQLVGGNLVNNGDFEFAVPGGGAVSTTPLYNWTYRSVSGSTSAIYDTANQFSGTYALKLSTLASGSRVFVYYNAGAVGVPDTSNGLSITPVIGVQYTCTYRMKTNYVSGSAATGARLEIQSKNSAGTTVESAAGSGVTTTTGYTLYSFTFTPTQAARALVLTPQVVGQDGTGTLVMDAWFDDISLTPTTNTVRSLVT